MNERVHTIYQHDPNIVARLIAGEMILVPIRKNVGDMEDIYTLNETGARIWELIDGHRSIAEICQHMVREYGIDPLLAEQDLIELIDNLLEEGVIVEQ
jgi:hypothetical protein